MLIVAANSPVGFVFFAGAWFAWIVVGGLFEKLMDYILYTRMGRRSWSGEPETRQRYEDYRKLKGN